jgi:hypothetical protein
MLKIACSQSSASSYSTFANPLGYLVAGSYGMSTDLMSPKGIKAAVIEALSASVGRLLTYIVVFSIFIIIVQNENESIRTALSRCNER